MICSLQLVLLVQACCSNASVNRSYWAKISQCTHRQCNTRTSNMPTVVYTHCCTCDSSSEPAVLPCDSGSTIISSSLYSCTPVGGSAERVAPVSPAASAASCCTTCHGSMLATCATWPACAQQACWQGVSVASFAFGNVIVGRSRGTA